MAANKSAFLKVTHDESEVDRLIDAFDADEMNILSQQLVPRITQEQRRIFDAITDAALNIKGIDFS